MNNSLTSPLQAEDYTFLTSSDEDRSLGPSHDSIDDKIHMSRRVNQLVSRARQMVLDHKTGRTILKNEDLELLFDFLCELLINRCRSNYYTFVRTMMADVMPDPFVDGRHIKIIAYSLEDFVTSIEAERKRPTERKQYYLPPGSSKTRMATILTPGWTLGRNPHWPIIVVGHTVEFAEDEFGKNIRNLIEASPRYKAVFPDTKVASDSRAVNKWKTTKRGGVISAGAGSQISGRRARMSICDDVISQQTTDIEKQKIRKWYGPELETRLLPEAGEMVINTRWALDDLSGFLLQNNNKNNRPWKVIRIPALLDQNTARRMNLKTNRTYWPEFKQTDDLVEKKNSPTMTKQKWSALYQQSPIPEEGSIVKPGDIRIWIKKEPPKVSHIFISLDTAFTKKEENDASAYTAWGVFSSTEKFKDKQSHGGSYQKRYSNLMLLDADEFRLEFPELCDRIVKVYKQRQPDSILIESMTSGISLIQELRRRGLPIEEYTPDKDKKARMHSASTFLRAGRIWFPKDYAFSELVQQKILEFPHGPHDDLADTVSQAILYARDKSYISHDAYDTSSLTGTDEEIEEEQGWYAGWFENHPEIDPEALDYYDDDFNFRRPNGGSGRMSYWDVVVNG